MVKPVLLQSTVVEGPDGSKIRIKFYDDGSRRFHLPGASPMVISEAYMQGGADHEVILKLKPDKQI